jgi:hypothetical protein
VTDNTACFLKRTIRWTGVLLQNYIKYFQIAVSTHFNCLQQVVSFPPCDKWVPVTTAWRVLRLRMEEQPPIWRTAANILNKQ